MTTKAELERRAKRFHVSPKPPPSIWVAWCPACQSVHDFADQDAHTVGTCLGCSGPVSYLRYILPEFDRPLRPAPAIPITAAKEDLAKTARIFSACTLTQTAVHEAEEQLHRAAIRYALSRIA